MGVLTGEVVLLISASRSTLIASSISTESMSESRDISVHGGGGGGIEKSKSASVCKCDVTSCMMGGHGGGGGNVSSISEGMTGLLCEVSVVVFEVVSALCC